METTFKFLILDKHKEERIDKTSGEIIFVPYGEWLTFEMEIDIMEVRISRFRSDVVFNDETPMPCTKVYLSDGSFLLAKNKIDTFRKKYKEEYIPLIKGLFMFIF